MKILIEDADFNDFNELANLARQGKIHTFCLTEEKEINLSYEQIKKIIDLLVKTENAVLKILKGAINETERIN